MTRGHVSGSLATAALRDLAAVLRNAGRPAPDRRSWDEIAREDYWQGVAEARAELAQIRAEDEEPA